MSESPFHKGPTPLAPPAPLVTLLPKGIGFCITHDPPPYPNEKLPSTNFLDSIHLAISLVLGAGGGFLCGATRAALARFL